MQWAKEGHLILTDGARVDDRVVYQKVMELNAAHTVEELIYDPWNASRLITEIAEQGVPCKSLRQHFGTLNEPSKELEKLIAGRQLKQEGCPVMRWCVSNVVVSTDAHGCIKPDKEKSKEKIDGVAAAVNAISGTLTYKAKPTRFMPDWS
jgi:phage terminase large subunit-like protein